MTDTTQNPANRSQWMSAALPWMIAALILLVLPMIFGSKGQLTILSQMGITVVFALAYNMLLGQGGCCPLAMRSIWGWGHSSASM